MFFVRFEELLFYLDGLKAFAGVLFGLVSMAVYWRVREGGEIAMDKFQLHEDEVLRDARVILWANVLMAGGMLVFVLAGLELVPLVLGNVLRSVYIGVIMYVLVKWVRILR